jgi:peptidyl-prolyl cis-trans isomerase D
VYEQADSFKAIAERLKLEIKTANNVQRKAAPDATGVLTNAKFLNALFAPDAVEKKRNTEAVEIGSNQLASGRIIQYTPARTLPFEQVKDKAREKLLAVQGADLARKEGMAKLAAWQAAPGSATLAEAVAIARDQSQKLPASMIDAALRADSSKLPVFVGVNLNDQGYAVIKVNKLLEREAKADAAKQDRQQYTQWWTNAESMAYYNGLKERFKAEIKVTKPVAKKDDVVVQQ